LPPEETKRLQIYDQLDRLGAAGVKALARGLQSSDVNLRLHVLLALGVLGGGWSLREDGSGLPKIDISAALPALMRALGDSNPNIRASAAFDIGEMGSSALVAVPKLAALLSDEELAVRVDACLGLEGIGPAAKSALPALRRTLSDPSAYVRKTAQVEITNIEEQPDPGIWVEPEN
jgi:HEAT repeat protein